MRLGRLPRVRNPAVPHFSALRAGVTLVAPPPSVDYTAGLPGNLGMFGNDSLGDCTCAALYHALQVWTTKVQAAIDTESDQDAVLLYGQACGYVPGDSNTDQGGVEQDVLTYALLNGIPVGANGAQQHRLAAFVEVDPTNQDDIKLAILECGVCYIGFNVPDYAMSTTDTWDVRPGTPNMVGGHAVVLAGYDSVGLTCITWGRLQHMTWAFFNQFTDEAYMLADPDWFAATGACPAGLTLPDLETQMAALRLASSS